MPAVRRLVHPRKSSGNVRRPELARSAQPHARIRCLAAAILGALGVGLAGLVSPVSAAVFGDDDRRPPSPAQRDIAANVGILSDGAGRPVCTAFCVGRRTVATAAHCLLRKGDRAITRPQSFSFALTPTPSGDAAARSLQTPLAGGMQPDGSAPRRLDVIAGSPAPRTRPPIGSSSDWALIHLVAPLCTAGGLRLAPQPAADVARSYAARRAVDFAYHKDLPTARIMAGGDCRLGEPIPGVDRRRIRREFARPEDLLLHKCDTAGGASGSPIVIDGPYGPEVAAINVGTYMQSTELIEDGEVVDRSSSGALANTAASAAPVAIGLAEFDADEPVSDRGSLIELEVLLAAAGAPSLANSSGDGPALRAAIVAYQERSGLPATGVATRALLQRLRDEAGSSLAAELTARRPLETGSTR